MKQEKSPLAADAAEEVSALIETLLETGQRLEKLTAGEVDTVADRDGRPFLLQHAQDHFRRNEAAKQAAILNALPAHIAVLDAQGVIISVSEAWRKFASTNGLLGPEYGIGVNYLELCDRAIGDDAAEAPRVAAGIRSVLAGAAKSFSLEYPCDSPAEKRWFLMTTTSLADDPLHGVVVMHLDMTERKQAEDALRESKTLLRLVVEQVPSRIFWKDRDLRFLGCNAQFAKDAGYSRPDELSGKTDFEMGWKDRAELYRADDRSVLESGTARLNIIEPQTTPDGNTIWLRTSKLPLRDKDDRIIGILGAYEDITERKAADAKIQRLTQLYAALSQCNEAIVRCASEEELLPRICRAAVQFGGMKMAWIGLVDTDTLRVRPIASFGDDTGYLRDLNVSVDADSPFGRGPAGTAIREKQPFWCQDFMNDPITVPWQERATRAGLAASASLPLHRNGVVVGTFSLYSAEANAFDAAARDLLVEMATDISFALDNFARESRRERAEEEIKFKNTILQTQQETSLDAILVVGENGQIISYNQRFIDLWQLSPQIVSARVDAPVFQSVADQVENSEAFAARVKYLTEHREDKSREEVQLKDGRIVDRYSAPIAGADGKHYGRVWYFRDITERKAAEARIAYLNRVYAVLSNINTLIVRVHDRDELFREACRIAVEAGGFRMALIGIVDPTAMKIALIASAGAGEEFLTALEDHFSLSDGSPLGSPLLGRAIRGKMPVVISDLQSNSEVVFGKRYAESGIRSMAVFPLMVADEAVGVLVLYAGESEFFQEEELKLLTELAGDIAFAIDHIDKQARLDYLAYYDVLTGLANRTLFLDRVAQYMRSAVSGGHKLAVFLIDLERFKSINDSLGQAAGDALLKQVAEWLTRNAGDANLLARLDADHFAAVLPELREGGDVVRLLEKTIEDIADHPFRLNDAVFRIAAKVGIAVFPDDGADADTLFRNAEAALKRAKASGERYLFYAQEMTAAVAGKLTLENQLRQALDNEEFVLHYQPKVDLASGKITSAEALIRWNDPRTGLVPPGRFIPILEETGLIYEVGRWALRQAIADYLRWRAAGLAAVRIAVNVSPLQLRNRGFVDEIRQVVGIDEQAADGLELEITESLIMEDIKHNIASLTAIRAMGISIAIDDFGTGFSSLSYLARLPVDTLKIDRSFVIDMTAGPEGLALVSTIINLAHSLKLKVVAEGVETEEQSRLLRLLDCNEMQGFLFSKPVPAEVFEAKFLTSPPKAAA